MRLIHIIAIFMLIATPVLGQPRYTVHDLGTLGGPVNEAYNVSADGRVVGRVLDPGLAAKAVLWVDGRVINLNGSSAAYGEARGISRDGLNIAGSVGNRAILWQSRKVTVLEPIPGHIASVAYDVNNAGMVIGWSVNSVGDPTAAKWVGGVLTQLDVNHSWAFAMNEIGQIVGRRDISTGREARLWYNDTAVTLPSLGGGNSASATNISPLGTIITGGSCEPISPVACAPYSVVWIGPTRRIVRLEWFPGALDQNAWAANDYGVLVGNVAFDFDGLSTRAVIWQLPDPAPVDLNTLIDPASGWKTESAQAVTQNGLIVGWGTHPGFAWRRPVLLRPIAP